jgi:hypothetical protein
MGARILAFLGASEVSVEAVGVLYLALAGK